MATKGELMRISHDVHVHTNLSSCSHDPEQTPANILQKAADLGLRTVGFADHLWVSDLPGASNWYRPQDEKHVLQIRSQLPAGQHSVRVLIGCESEFTGTACGIDAARAAYFDFVLLPCTHFHMLNFVRPAHLITASEQGALLLERLDKVLDYDFVTGIAHPFVAVNQGQVHDEMCRFLLQSDQLSRCLDKAAAKRISLEITKGYFPQLFGKVDAQFHDESVLPILEKAKRAGCLFHFASDAHDLHDFGAVLKMQPLADQLCLREQDIHPLFRDPGE